MNAHNEWPNDCGAGWLWLKSAGDGPNQYMQALQDFDLSESDLATSVELAVSADSNYAAWVNGHLAGFGQWGNFPDDKTFDLLDISTLLHPGKNRLCVLAYYQGEDSFQYEKGAPGVLFAVRSGEKTVATSGRGTSLRQSPCYVSKGLPRVTPQLGFVFEFHEEKDDSWTSPGYDPAGAALPWAKASDADVAQVSGRPVRPRPIRKLVLKDRLPMRMVSQGAFLRLNDSPNVAADMQSDALTFRPSENLFRNPLDVLMDGQTTGVELNSDSWKEETGAYVVLDTGQEEAGLFDLELDAPAGTIVDMAYGEHLDDLRVRAHVGPRNFASRYVCGAGHRRFLHPFLRIAGRYVELHITPPKQDAAPSPIILKYAGIRPTDYPVDLAGAFESPDSLDKEIWTVSRRTLELCMHEHYEDCPWREQSLYAMDMRNQALAGYYCFGNYDFARESIRLLGQGMNHKDHLLEMCAPAKIHITIPCFSLAWILTLDDYLQFSGDRDFVREELPIAREILDGFAANTSGSLALTPHGERMWNYYEWQPGLDGADKSFGPDVCEAPLNLFYALALDATTRMTEACGGQGGDFAARSTVLKSEIVKTFWDDQRKAFKTRINDGHPPHFAELTQSLAILAGAVPEDRLPALCRLLADRSNGLVPCTLSSTQYKFDALLTDPETWGPRVVEQIRHDWGYMLRQGATSFWETIDGASAFHNAGSLCHGWSGVPAYIYSRYLLGVKPDSPGFATYSMHPLVEIVDSAKGLVPTPSGILKASWHLENGKPVTSLVEEKRP